MKKRGLNKKNKFWKELMKFKRKDYNQKHKNSDVSLNHCIHHIESGYGDTNFVFKDDASDDEISKVLEEADKIL